MSDEAKTTKTAAMVVIGNEILSGKVADTNSPFLARLLRQLGVALERVIVIPDEIPVIAETVASYSVQFDYVFTSGGVGPTHDDMTMAGVASAFDVAVIEHPELRATIERLAGVSPGAAYLKMAEVPEGSSLVEAGGRNFPTVLMRNVYVLPGIPEIFEAKLLALQDEFRTRPFFLRQVFVSASEASIAEHLNATLAGFPELMLGSYPKLAHPEYRVRLTLESKDEQYLDAALSDLIARLPDGFIVRVER